MHVYGCAHASHVRIRLPLVIVCFIQIQPGLALVQEKHAWKKLMTDENICHDYIRRDEYKMLHWSKTRGTPQHNPSTHESLSCANKRTTTAASSRKKQYLFVAPLHHVYEYHTVAAPSLYVRRVWMIRIGYMRKHVVHVPMSRNVTTVWMLTWTPNLSL